MELEGKNALVTGAGHRIGRDIAVALAKAGANVAVHYGGSREKAEKTAEELEALGVDAWPVQADLSEPEEIEGLFDRFETRCGTLDILVNSAASFRSQPFEKIDAEDWDEVQAVNLRAPFLCIRRAAALMTRDSNSGEAAGAVVNIADLSGIRPWQGYAHHSVSKAGLIHLTLTAARELAPRVRVNCVVPGAILPPPGMSADDPEWQRRGKRVPLGRTGHGEEIADAVVFLVRSDFVTGVVLPVDGGDHLLGASAMK